jgi:hypothetical protein
MSSTRRVVTLDHAAVLLFLATAACGAGDDTEAVDIAFSFCADDAPVWVAVQDGNLAWTAVQPTSGSSYAYTLTTGRGGVAYVPPTEDGLVVNYGTAAELNTIYCVNGAKTVNGTAANVGVGEFASIHLGFSEALVNAGASTDFSLTDVGNGPLPLVGVRGGENAAVVNAIILRHGVDATSGSILPTLDFDSEEAVAPAIANVTLSNVSGELQYIASSYQGTNLNADALLGMTAVYNGGPGADPFAAIPTAKLGADDIEFLQALIFDEDLRVAGVFFRNPVQRTLTFGPQLNPVTVTTTVTTPYLQPQVQVASQASYGQLLYVYYQQETRFAIVATTANYLGSTPVTWTLALPNVSAATGWDNAWGLQADEPMEWQLTAQGGPNPGFNEPVHDGDEMHVAIAFSPSASLRQALKVKGRPEPRRWGFAAAGSKRK